MSFLFPHGKLLISMAVKCFFIALLTCLNKVKFGMQSIYFTVGGRRGKLSQKVSSMKVSQVEKVSFGLIF